MKKWFWLLIIFIFVSCGVLVIYNNNFQRETLDNPIQNKSSNLCVAKYGETASVACGEYCNNCTCPTTNSKTLANGYSLLTRDYISQNSICLNTQVYYADKLENEGIWYYSADKIKDCPSGKVSEPCKCGDYYCGYYRNDPWNYCENNKCLSKSEGCTKSSDCNDNNSCTIDSCHLDLSNICKYESITVCNKKERDGCCPVGCNNSNDVDCPIRCEDGTDDQHCSVNKPYFCYLPTEQPTLIKWCVHCGCPEGLTCGSDGGCR